MVRIILSPTLRCCEGEMEGMGETECLVHVGLKDRGERSDLRDQSEVGEKKGSKVPVAHKDKLDKKESKG